MKKRLFIDTNIMLDFLGEREPFYIPSAQLATLADRKEITMVVSPISFATVNYFIAKSEGHEGAKNKLRKFEILCEIVILDRDIIEKGLNSDFIDFEDSLQYFSAITSNCDILITRNGKDFKKSQIPIMSADEYLKSL